MLTQTDEFVGACGFRNSTEYGGWEIWLQLRFKFWGKGIGPEVTRALIEIAFTSLDAQRVIGIVAPANHSSLNMIKKLGFGFLRGYAGKSQWQQGHHVYAIDRRSA